MSIEKEAGYSPLSYSSAAFILLTPAEEDSSFLILKWPSFFGLWIKLLTKNIGLILYE